MPITAVIEAAEKLAVAEKHVPAARPAPEQPAFGSVEAEMTGARASEMLSNNLYHKENGEPGRKSTAP